MKKKFIKYISLIIGVIISILIYLSIFGIETEKFNNKIIDRVNKNNSNLDLKLKKIKLTLDPLNLRINAKTIGAQIIYQKKILELEFIKTQIPFISIIDNKLSSSKLEISTKAILLKDLVKFIRLTTNRTEMFFLEHIIKNGHVILDIYLNFDEEGKVKDNYEVKGILKDGRLNILKEHNFEKINFLLDIKNNIFSFKDIRFTTDKMNFYSDNVKVIQNKKDFIFKGIVENKNSKLNYNLQKITKLNFENIIFSSKNNFSFKIDDKLRLKNVVLDSEINVDEFQYKKPDFISEYFPKVENTIFFKDHKIKVKFENDDYSIKGFGKIKIQKKFDEIEYLINNKNNDINLISKINFNKLVLKNHKFLKNFFPNIKNELILKQHQVEINYNKDNLSFKGVGEIQLDKKFNIIDYSISKTDSKFHFDTKLNLDKTLLTIDYLNFKKEEDLSAQIEISGHYKKNEELNLKKISIISKDNKINLDNLFLDNENKIIKVDQISLNYFDMENKENQFIFQRKQENNYEIIGSIFNANSLISDLFKNKNDGYNPKIFKNDINLNVSLKKVYIDDNDLVKNLIGNFYIKDNKILQADVSALFDDSESLKFTINTDNDEKITTLFSSRAKPLVKRYKFIKGYEEGYLDFYSSKKDSISKSKLKIYNFKLQKLPTLTKLLTLASLQGIADTLSGEGIRFNEFEMNFINQDNLMTINEIYAIGPAISILMSGYVEQDKLVSLRGTLVPATTINKTISSIPILGKILVGNKTGEGVFGVSFKIKGPPKNLKTTVNPIKTLTPRFITRTLEKIKKN